MKKVIILNKNKSTEVVKEKNFKYEKEVEYILIPLNSYELHDTFLCIKANKYMNFDNAKIEIKLANAVNDTECEEYSDLSLFNDLNIETSSIIELYNYIHSINKLEYFNDIINANLENLTQRAIDILAFKIKLYKHDQCIFEYIFNRLDNSDDILDEENIAYDLGMIDYGFTSLFKGIKNIYETISDALFINKKTNKWSFDDDKYYNCICGIMLFHTHTSYFVSPTEYFEFCKIPDQTIIMQLDILAGIGIPNLKDFTYVDDIDEYISEEDCEYYESLEIYHNRKTMLEFLVYAHFLYNAISLSYSMDIGIGDFNPVTSFRTGKGDKCVIFDLHSMPKNEDFKYFLERMRS